MDLSRYAQMGYKIDSDTDLFDVSTGLADDFDAMVVDVKFACDASYNVGQSMLCHLALLSNDPDVGEQKLMLSVGTGWNSPDGGKTVIHERGKLTFNQTSNYGRLIKRLNDLGMKDLLKSRAFAPFDSQMLTGAKFHWKREEAEKLNFGDRADDGKVRTRLLPSAFLGFGSEEEINKALAGYVDFDTTPSAVSPAAGGNKNTPATPATPATPVASAAPASGAGAGGPLSGVDSAIVTQLTAIAQNVDSAEEFTKMAIGISGLKENRDLFMKVINPASGLWAQLKNA